MSRLSEALNALKQGGTIVLVDDEDRENEGDLVMAAEFATPESVNFMARYGRGLICLALDGAQVDRLGLRPMVARNRTARQTAFTVSIEAATGITTGISAHDRARTIQVACDPASTEVSIQSPGHVFPLRAVEGGVLVRQGHTEGSTDLMRLAGLRPAAVICEVMKDDGTMMRLPDLRVFAAEHGLPVLSIAELVAYRLEKESVVEEVATASLPSAFASRPFTVKAFRSRVDGTEHLAIIKGPIGERPLVRVHSECLTGDALGSLRCDCGAQLQQALKRIGEAPSGVLVYLRGQEGRGIGLCNKIRAYALQDTGLDTVEANAALGLAIDSRDYATAAQMLRHLGVKSPRLLTNNPRKTAALQAFGLGEVTPLPLRAPVNEHSARYLSAKREKLGHQLDPIQT